MKQLLTLVACILTINVTAQDATALLTKVKAKIDKVADYEASGSMKTDVNFIKAPTSKVKVYFKKPNKFKLKRDGGISILPKGGISINLGTVVTITNFTIIDAGTATVAGSTTKVVKLLPNSETSDIILSTLYIDETQLLIKKAITTTKENGTYEIEMNYGKYADWSLPDKVTFSFNLKDYKMPKGITLDFNDEKPSADKLKNKKGKVEITYTNYNINKGLADSVFQ
jgi:outer membrane lipoprotein-sorting protein